MMTYKKLYQRIRESTGLDVLTENVLQTIIENCFADITSRGYREFCTKEYTPSGFISSEDVENNVNIRELINDIQKGLDRINNISVEDLRGEQGIQGEQGLKGDKGDKGDTGATGPSGADGLPGRDGIDGIDGIDGVDGKDGVSIENIEIINGELVVVLSE